MNEPEVGAARSPDHGRIAALCASGLGIGADYFAARMLRDPASLPGAPLVVRESGRVVSSVHALGLELVFGSARVPCGGIANVVTDPEARGRGHARRLLSAAHGLMRDRGFPVSLLSTAIPDFYRPAGYAVWPHDETHLLKIRPPAGSGPGPTVRRLDFDRDRDAILALRAEYARGFCGTAATGAETWSAQPVWTPLYPHEDPELALVAEGADGRPAAWIRAAADPGRGWSKILDFGCAPGNPDAVSALARTYLRAVFLRGVRGLQYPAPCRELAEALAPFAEAQADVSATYLMLRIADLTGFLRSLTPELGVRAARAGIAAGSVVVECGDDSAAIRIADGGVGIAPGADAAPDAPRAVLGAAQWVEVLGGVKPFFSQPFAHASTVGDREIVLLDALFPKRSPLFWEIDAF